MRDQVVPPDVIHMEEHVYRARDAEHPKAKRCDGAKPTNKSEHGRREAAELEAAIRHSCKLAGGGAALEGGAAALEGVAASAGAHDAAHAADDAASSPAGPLLKEPLLSINPSSRYMPARTRGWTMGQVMYASELQRGIAQQRSTGEFKQYQIAMQTSPGNAAQHGVDLVLRLVRSVHPQTPNFRNANWSASRHQPPGFRVKSEHRCRQWTDAECATITDKDGRVLVAVRLPPMVPLETHIFGDHVYGPTHGAPTPMARLRRHVPVVDQRSRGSTGVAGAANRNSGRLTLDAGRLPLLRWHSSGSAAGNTSYTQSSCSMRHRAGSTDDKVPRVQGDRDARGVQVYARYIYADGHWRTFLVRTDWTSRQRAALQKSRLQPYTSLAAWISLSTEDAMKGDKGKGAKAVKADLQVARVEEPRVLRSCGFKGWKIVLHTPIERDVPGAVRALRHARRRAISRPLTSHPRRYSRGPWHRR